MLLVITLWNIFWKEKTQPNTLSINRLNVHQYNIEQHTDVDRLFKCWDNYYQKHRRDNTCI
jgi:hypothetical protein